MLVIVLVFGVSEAPGLEETFVYYKQSVCSGFELFKHVRDGARDGDEEGSGRRFNEVLCDCVRTEPAARLTPRWADD